MRKESDVIKEDLKNLSDKRVKTEIFTRVMWYHRPVSLFNIWKKAEYYSRKNFSLKEENDNFNNKYNKNGN